MRRRRGSRSFVYATAVVVAAALSLGVVVVITSAPATADAISGPLLLAGSDCDENGPFIQYRVTNETGGEESLSISIDNFAVIGTARVASAEAKRGRIRWEGNPAESVVLAARWASNEKAPISAITVAPNPCATTSASGLTGPAFMAGIDCVDERAVVRWWMSNTSGEQRTTTVAVSNEEGTIGETIWPSDGRGEFMFAGAQTSGSGDVPGEFLAGTKIRVSGWAEGSSGAAETWTLMVVPRCGADTVLADGGAASTTATSVAAVGPASSTTVDPLQGILSTSPPVATTAGPGDATTTLPPTSTVPGETTTTVPGETTTTTTSPPGSTTTSPPGSTTTSPPGSTTTSPPGSTTTTTVSPTTTTTTTTSPPTTTTTTSPPGGAVVPPVFLAGADCDLSGEFIRYRVTNNNVSTLTLNITFDGATRVSTVSVSGGQTKWGTFAASGQNDPKPVIASWVGQSGSDAPTLLIRASICESDLPQPARGPSFVAGQDCSGGTPIVRWWMKNSAPTSQSMNVTITQADNTGELIVWPSGGGTVDVEPDVQTAGVATMASGYNSPGQEIRVRGWWRGLDADSHNRVGIIVEAC